MKTHPIYNPHTGKTEWLTDKELNERLTFPNLKELEPGAKIENPLPGNGLFGASRGEIEAMLSGITAKL
jgi:hypothetical protein